MRSVIYPDSLLLRRLVLVDDHYIETQRDRLIDFYKNKFGISCNFVKCPYLFLEFIGCKKKHLDIRSPTPLQLDPQISYRPICKSHIELIDKQLEKVFLEIHLCVRKQLIAHKEFIQERLNTTLNRSYKDLFSKKIISNLFNNYINFAKNDFLQFVKIFSLALTWDVFATLETNNLKVIRERQLGNWFQVINSEYPFGKIIDDLSNYYAHKFPNKNFLLKASEDMVDSKMMTLSITGDIIDGTIRRVNVITFDTNVTAERAKLALGSIKNIEESLDMSIPKKLGSIYCLSEPENEKDPFNVEIIQNQYIIQL